MAYPTNPIYKLVNGIEDTPICVITVQNGVYLSIPFDEANSDYQAYLEWKAIDGNEPEAAD